MEEREGRRRNKDSGGKREMKWGKGKRKRAKKGKGEERRRKKC